MTLSDASLTELLAELRERLRRFAAEPPHGVVGPPAPGPLDLAGRAALAVRLVAAGLAADEDPERLAVAGACDDLAATLQRAAEPLPGSAEQESLRRVVRAFEDLAIAWDSGAPADPRPVWGALREAGDNLWGESPAPVGVVEDVESVSSPAIWLLVGGNVRRTTIERRLLAAGLDVECLDDVEVVAARLVDERPAALVCDDAAPSRHRLRLSRLLPEPKMPIIEIRGRADGRGADKSVWLPPFRLDDLLARLEG